MLPYLSSIGLPYEVRGATDYLRSCLMKNLFRLLSDRDGDEWGEYPEHRIYHDVARIAHLCIPTLEQRYQEAGDAFRL